MRAHARVPWLRTQGVLRRIEQCLARAQSASRISEGQFRVLQFSVQSDHVHLLIEAADRRALSRGMQGLAIRLARRVNSLLRRKGPFWGDRYHARALTTPREVRNAIVYVLQNFKKHQVRADDPLDEYSSAHWFDGWVPRAGPYVRELGALHAQRHRRTRGEAEVTCPVRPARTWLGSVGWRMHGCLQPSERPRAPG